MSFNYSPKIVTDGLVLYLDAANTKSYFSGSTTWTDLSRSGNNGTLTNGPTFDSNNGGSIVFDGVNDYVSVSNITGLLNPNSSGTIDFTYKLNFAQTQNYQDIWGFNSNFDNVFWFENSELTNPSPIMRWVWRYDDLTFGAVSSGIPFDDLNINNIICTYSVIGGQTSFKLYRNGVLFSQLTISKNIYNVNVSKLNIGTGIFSSYSKCSFYNFKTYNRELSATEVLQNYNALKNRFAL